MRLAIFLMIAVALICCKNSLHQQKQAIKNDSLTSSVKNYDMEDEKIILEKGTTHELFIPNRGTSGLQLVFDLSDSSVASVDRKELPPDITKHLKPGDPLPAYYVVKGNNIGESKLIFSERRVGMPDSPNLPLKSYLIIVN